MEWNDVYDKDRNLTGKVHRRGSRWKNDEYGLVVCVWVHDGHGKLLLTRRAKGKTAAGTWENSGGAAQAGETSLQAIIRELREETGIQAQPEEFTLLESTRDGNTHYDHYCLCKDIPISQIVLQEGETDAAQWVTFAQIHRLIEQKQICRVIANQFQRHEQSLLTRQYVQD